MVDLDERYAGFLTQPPITRVSRVLRQESLDVFLKCCTMSIVIIQEPSFITPRFVAGASTTKFLKKAPIECLRAIRKLRLRGWLDFDHYDLPWEVSLDKPAIQVEWFGAHRRLAMSNDKDRMAAFESRLREMIAARKDRSGRFVLQQGDEVALPAMLDNYWSQ